MNKVLTRFGIVAILMMGTLFTTSLAVQGRDVAIATVEDIEPLIPSSFDDWQEIELSNFVKPKQQDEEGTISIYKTYRSSQGVLVTLAIAHGGGYGDAVRLHRPETCYKAQGYATSNIYRDTHNFNGHLVPLIYMDADNDLRQESIAYWMRVGNGYANGRAAQQLSFMTKRNASQTHSTLIRASVRNISGQNSEQILNSFLSSFVKGLSQDAVGTIIADHT